MHYIHTYVRKYIHTHIHTYIHTYTHTYRHTLMIARTDWTAVPHAGLGYHFLRVQVRTTAPGGLQKEKGPKAQVEVETTG